jgi:acetyl esterase/lipase
MFFYRMNYFSTAAGRWTFFLTRNTPETLLQLSVRRVKTIHVALSVLPQNDMKLFLQVSFLRIMRRVNFSRVVMDPVKCSPAFKVALWLGGLSNVFVGIFTGIWWPFFTAVAVSLHVRLPVPLGMVPPIFDATGNAFVTSAASAIGTLTLLLAYFYKNPTWLLSSLFFFGKSLRHQSDMALIRQRFRVLEINSKLSSMSNHIYPPMPLLVRAHPYFLRLYRDVDLGGGVRIRRIKPSTASIRQFSSSIDFWYREFPTTASSRENIKYFTEPLPMSPLAAASKATYGTMKKPLFFFIHGGGWKGGGSRRHTQPALLHRLVLNGWAVVACNYRKKEWPQHLDDCYNALQYLISDAESLNIDVSRIVISGASAGGQLAALLQARLKADATAAKNESPVSVAIVLFYPAIDPADDTNFTTSFPFDLPFLKAKRGQSLMQWFFERAILNDDSSKW